MKINNIYIISWFGADPVLAEKRRAIHKTQLEWCQKHNLHPIIFAQEYRESDYVDGVTYIRHAGPVLHPGPARNILLKHFYQTDEDYAVFADNDGILYEASQHGDSAHYIELMRKQSTEDFCNIDLIEPVNPARVAFTKELEDKAYGTQLIYRKTNKMKGTLFFLKNIKKHKGSELFFDEVTFNDNGKIITGEDTEFCVAALFQGLGCYYTYNAILNELATNYSTWIATEERVYKNIVPVYNLMNKKYQCNLYKIPTDSAKMFTAIGYSTRVNGKRIFRLAAKESSRRAVLEKHNDTDIVFYTIPPMSIADAMQYALANIDDVTLRDLLNELMRKNKKFVNRGKTRIKFDWNLVPHKIVNKISITKKL